MQMDRSFITHLFRLFHFCTQQVNYDLIMHLAENKGTNCKYLGDGSPKSENYVSIYTLSMSFHFNGFLFCKEQRYPNKEHTGSAEFTNDKEYHKCII